MSSHYQGQQSSSSSSNSNSESPHSQQEEIDYEPGYRPRKRYTQQELEILQESFNNNPRPSNNERRRLAELCNTTEKSIRIWFQNKRAQVRKQQRYVIERRQQEQQHRRPSYQKRRGRRRTTRR
ncbi:Homeodomain-like protein [Circinella umbellata]|nr:Homeodomain-like protein [Circinella umbellata]